MSKEIDICPPCAAMLQQQIYKIQIEMQKIQGSENNGIKVEEKPKEAEHKTPELAKGKTYEKATPEELEKCLASLSYAVPICEFCKNHKNITIIKLPMHSFSLRNPETEETKTGNQNAEKAEKSS